MFVVVSHFFPSFLGEYLQRKSFFFLFVTKFNNGSSLNLLFQLHNCSMYRSLSLTGRPWARSRFHRALITFTGSFVDAYLQKKSLTALIICFRQGRFRFQTDYHPNTSHRSFTFIINGIFHFFFVCLNQDQWSFKDVLSF